MVSPYFNSLGFFNVSFVAVRVRVGGTVYMVATIPDTTTQDRAQIDC